MNHGALIEAAARALEQCKSPSAHDAARAVLAAVTPLIRAAALEEAATAMEGMTAIPFSDEQSAYVHGQIDAFNEAAAGIRALKEQP